MATESSVGLGSLGLGVSAALTWVMTWLINRALTICSMVRWLLSGKRGRMSLLNFLRCSCVASASSNRGNSQFKAWLAPGLLFNSGAGRLLAVAM